MYLRKKRKCLQRNSHNMKSLKWKFCTNFINSQKHTRTFTQNIQWLLFVHSFIFQIVERNTVGRLCHKRYWTHCIHWLKKQQPQNNNTKQSPNTTPIISMSKQKIAPNAGNLIYLSYLVYSFNVKLKSSYNNVSGLFSQIFLPN